MERSTIIMLASAGMSVFIGAVAMFFVIRLVRTKTRYVDCMACGKPRAEDSTHCLACGAG